jgi:hypothetical protein
MRGVADPAAWGVCSTLTCPPHQDGGMGPPPRQIHGALAPALDPWWDDVDLAVWWAFLHPAMPPTSTVAWGPPPLVDPCSNARPPPWWIHVGVRDLVAFSLSSPLVSIVFFSIVLFAQKVCFSRQFGVFFWVFSVVQVWCFSSQSGGVFWCFSS